MQDPMRRLAALNGNTLLRNRRVLRESRWRVKPPSEVSTTALQWIEGSTAQRGGASPLIAAVRSPKTSS